MSPEYIFIISIFQWILFSGLSIIFLTGPVWVGVRRSVLTTRPAGREYQLSWDRTRGHVHTYSTVYLTLSQIDSFTPNVTLVTIHSDFCVCFIVIL